jgi:hypothetical protein
MSESLRFSLDVDDLLSETCELLVTRRAKMADQIGLAIHLLASAVGAAMAELPEPGVTLSGEYTTALGLPLRFEMRFEARRPVAH